MRISYWHFYYYVVVFNNKLFSIIENIYEFLKYFLIHKKKKQCYFE